MKTIYLLKRVYDFAKVTKEVKDQTILIRDKDEGDKEGYIKLNGTNPETIRSNTQQEQI